MPSSRPAQESDLSHHGISIAAQNELNAETFSKRLKLWREWLVDLQTRLCSDVVTIALANRECLGRDPLTWVSECIDNYWATRRVGFKNWAVLACDWADIEGWSAPGWLLSQVPDDVLRLHIQVASLAETLDGRVSPPYTEVIRIQIASVIEMRLLRARTAVLDDAKIKIASEPAPKSVEPSASSIARVNEAVYAIGRKYGTQWDKKWLESTRELYAELHPRQVKQPVEESSTQREGVRKLKLIEPPVSMFIGETIEPVPVWIRANEGPRTGLIAHFCNTSGAFDRTAMPALGVIACLAYTGVHGERLIVGSCCWLDRLEQRIDFRPGETHKLVLAVVTEDDQTTFALENRRGQISTEGGYDPGIMPLPVGELPCKVELGLIDKEGRSVFKAEFLLEEDKDKIVTARNLASAGSDADAMTGGKEVTQGVAGDPLEPRKSTERNQKLPSKEQDLSEYFDNAKLTGAQREAMSLRYEYGMSKSAIAKYLGIHRKTVDERISAANAKLEINEEALRRARRRAIKDPEGYDR